MIYDLYIPYVINHGVINSGFHHTQTLHNIWKMTAYFWNLKDLTCGIHDNIVCKYNSNGIIMNYAKEIIHVFIFDDLVC